MNAFKVICLSAFALVFGGAIVSVFGYLLFQLLKSGFILLFMAIGWWAVPASVLIILAFIGFGYAVDSMEDDGGYL